VERQIEKITLQEARRYGMSETQSNGRIKYTYAGLVFIFDPKHNRAITSWKIDSTRPCKGKTTVEQPSNEYKKKKKESKSGTRFYKPIMIQKSQDHESMSLKLSHEEITTEVHKQKEKWASHTVIVVDMSGSMRDDDVDGARCRSDGVWTALARDYIKQQLEDGTCSAFDLVSVVAMRSTAKVVIQCEPMTYVLYNKLVAFREWENMKPEGHGNYKPAMEQAAKLLAINASGSCSLTLMFFSDGKPSDFHQEGKEFSWQEYDKVQNELAGMAGNIGSTFGRRLSFVCVGMAGDGENFATLKKMAEEAKMFGAQATFNRPLLNSRSLSEIVTSSVVSSLASKLELTSVKTGKARLVRTDVERESNNAPDDTKVNENWRAFLTSSGKQYVQNVWVWNQKVEDFARIINPGCNNCYKPVATHSYQVLEIGGSMCPKCKACYFCARCMAVGGFQCHRKSSECSAFTEERRSGFLVGGSKCPLSYNVAWKKQAFGEGAERLAFKFRFVDRRGQFTGPVMVAKESRFVEDVESSTKTYLSSHRHAYHKTFMRTQSVAARFAKLFNRAIEEELDEIPPGVPPKIEFVKPHIFELEDRDNAKSYNVLVEPLIAGRYEKFTDNFGAQAGVKRDFSEENRGIDLVTAAALLGRNYNDTVKTEASKFNAISNPIQGLGIIAEGASEGGESDEESSSSDSVSFYGPAVNGAFDTSLLCSKDYLFAFSHFTFVRSGGQLMVVDLQGALQISDSREETFLLTDPAIHHRRKKSDRSRLYGRTDLGGQGMRAFFESHVCNGICRLFQFQEKNAPNELDKLYCTKTRE